MALWGKADSVYSVGTVSVNYSNKVVTGSGTSFEAASVGDVITIGAGATFGSAVIASIASQTSLTLKSVDHLTGVAAAGVAYTMSQRPKSTLHDTHWGEDEIYGVDETEAGVARTTAYAVAHAGWVGLTTYTDMHGNVRVKSEVLVAMSGISSGTSSYTATGDADDDGRFEP
jgi:hypothetical protein